MQTELEDLIRRAAATTFGAQQQVHGALLQRGKTAEHPFSTPVALQIASAEQGDGVNYAQRLARTMQTSDEVESAVVVSPGFVNFDLTPAVYARALCRAAALIAARPCAVSRENVELVDKLSSIIHAAYLPRLDWVTSTEHVPLIEHSTVQFLRDISAQPQLFVEFFADTAVSPAVCALRRKCCFALCSDILTHDGRISRSYDLQALISDMLQTSTIVGSTGGITSAMLCMILQTAWVLGCTSSN